MSRTFAHTPARFEGMYAKPWETLEFHSPLCEHSHLAYRSTLLTPNPAERVPCDLGEPDGDCYYYVRDCYSKQPYARDWNLAIPVWGRERRVVRDTLVNAAKEYNTFGSTDVDVPPKLPREYVI